MTFEHRGNHDWLSAEYVQEWISSDVTRDAERAPMLREMLALAGRAKDEPLEVLDVGAGYGLVSRIVLEEFPNARVTLQDYSEPMLAHARKNLEHFRDRTRLVLADLTDAEWHTKAGGPFDLAVSAIAIHNLRDPDKIAAAYEGVRKTLKPGGVFLDCDYVFAGGLDGHISWLKQAGFQRVKAEMKAEPLAVLAASA